MPIGSLSQPHPPAAMPIRLAVMVSSMRGGGAEQQTLLLLRHLDRTRFAPRLWVLQAAGELMAQIPGDVPVDEVAAPPGRIYIPGRQHARNAARVADLARRHRVDLIYDQTFAMTALAAAAVDRQGLPRVSIVMSPPHRAVPLLERRFVWLKRRRLAAAYRRSRHVFAVSADAAGSAEAYYRLPPGHVQPLPSAVDVDRLRSVPQSDQRRGIVVVGRMTVEKGHADLIEALARVPIDYLRRDPVRLIGDGPLRRSLADAVDRAGLRDVVEFTGQLADAAPAIAAAKLLILPSRFEGLPNVVLEAMAVGTPVLATAAGGTPEVSPDWNDPTIALVPPADPAAMADELTRLLDDQPRRDRLVAAATRRIDDHHAVGPVFDRLQEAFGRAVEPSARRCNVGQISRAIRLTRSSAS